ncbi:MAG: 50S ribosomal protein L3 N(5)-glutamine methyltransferase [Luminiphilus sp.]|nr:50S ribosomal protein L3 N(5)-glutamine methyltransferase [Luminiphilus sp.]
MSSFGAKLAQLTQSLTAADIFCGHGYESIHDEAVALLLCAAELAPEQTTDLLEHPFPDGASTRLSQMLRLRMEQRLPLAYVLGEAWLAGIRFRCDSRALVPRSPIAGVLLEACRPWWCAEGPPHTVVDLCCGGGSLGIIAAHIFPAATVLLTDIDEQALALASENIDLTRTVDRIACCRADLLSALATDSVDLIVANPPYVSAAEMTQLPPEYAHEPRGALEAEEAGTALAVAMLRDAARVLSRDGLLVFEVGESAEALERRLPRVPFTWVDLPQGGSGVAVASAQELQDWIAAGIL